MRVTLMLEFPDREEQKFAKEYEQLQRKLSATGFMVVQRKSGEPNGVPINIDFQRKTVLSAIETFGKEAQLIMAMEEMSELIQALSKNIRGADNVDNIAEEIADVEIMILQLIEIFNCVESETDWYMKKLQRLNEKVEEVKKRQINLDIFQE